MISTSEERLKGACGSYERDSRVKNDRGCKKRRLDLEICCAVQMKQKYDQ